MTSNSLQRLERDNSGLDQAKVDLNAFSTGFKSMNRQTKDTWVHGKNKKSIDFSLDNEDMQKNKKYIKNLPRFKKTFKSGYKRKSTSSSDLRINVASAKKQSIRVSLIKTNKEKDSQKLQIKEKPQYSTLETSGLCKFQFQNTIKGKLKFKSNHHILFQNQKEREDNMVHTWYDPNIQLKKKQISISQKRSSSIHDFNSYTERRVFQPRDELDIFYNTKKAHQKCSPKKIKGLVKINKLPGRKALFNQSSFVELQYNQYEAKDKVLPKPPNQRMCKSQRKTQFKPQVILPTRGCYR